MKITFLGTGADDWDWADLRPGVRKSTCSLLGSSCLLDAGPCVLAALSEAGVSPARISSLLVTHSHGDHFHPESILAIARAGRRRLRVFAPPTALAALVEAEGKADAGASGAIEPHPVLPGDVFRVAGMRVLALPANHVVARRPAEQPLHYALDGRGVRLLYALDGGWFCAKARLALKDFLRDSPFDAIVWDSTCGDTFHDWRFAEHNDLKMIDAMRKSMLGAGLVAPGTVHVFDHVARTLWPKSLAAQRRLAERFSGILAEDGLVLDLEPTAKTPSAPTAKRS